jgi:hypothetical protein
MATTITYPGGIIAPTLVNGYDSERATGTVVHQILGRSDPDVTIRPAALRSGRLRLIFADTPASSSDGGLVYDGDGYIVETGGGSVPAGADSKACEDAHAAGGVFTLGGEERTSIPMSYVPKGAIRRTLDPDTMDVWIVEVDFHEVTL